VDAKLVKAFSHPDPEHGLRNAKSLAAQLDKNYPSAAASLREGLEEMFTVARLGIDGRLAKTLTTSNPIESMISIARTTNRNVTLARRPDGAALDRRGHAQRRTILPPHQGIQADAPTGRRPPPTRSPRHRICRCRRLRFTMDRHPNSTRVGTCSIRGNPSFGGRSEPCRLGPTSSEFYCPVVVLAADCC